jgi:uncharacterized Zn finger protein
MYYGGYGYGFAPYVPVAERRRRAERQMEKLRKQGHPVSPVRIEGRTIARTFWGKAWCDNLERYSDFSNRLPRGRTYVRNGSVVDLQVEPRQVTARVVGSELYRVAVKIAAVPPRRWRAIVADCAGAIDSLVELLRGRFSKGVMERICREKTGLFPAPADIALSCSCPDWATMCKHVAATLYGVGARLDERPELLFLLRDVDEKDLIAKAGRLPLSKKGLAAGRVLADDALGEMFGLDMAEAGSVEPPSKSRTPASPPPRRRPPTPDSARIAALERELRALKSGHVAAVARPKLTMTAKVRAMRKRQGQYLGILRRLEGHDRTTVMAVARKEGVEAALTAAQRLLR